MDIGRGYTLLVCSDKVNMDFNTIVLKFLSDTMIFTPNPASPSLHEILRYAVPCNE